MKPIRAFFLLSCPAWFLPPPSSADEPVSYSRDVLPFLEDQCLACHDEGLTSGKLSLVDLDAMKAGGRHGAAIAPGKGEESLVIQYMKGTRQPQMPPRTQLPLDRIDVVRRWIDRGRRWTSPGPTPWIASGAGRPPPRPRPPRSPPTRRRP